MIQLAKFVLERLRQGPEFDLFRGTERDQSTAVLVLAPGAAHQSPTNIARLEHECGLASVLDPAWAVQPLAVVHHEGRAMLVLADPGGDPLDCRLPQPMELSRFLCVAVGLAAALREVHRRGLIHQDIKPAHVIADAAGNTWFTGFGIAMRRPPARQRREAPAQCDRISGTLAYMAPEQTGRMNRVVDARSDLYSLGVTMYELLTGSLPFTAADPMEWIHCHVARTPRPPSALRPGLPAMIDAIVLRLLAKNPEDRYQTAAGLERDLRKCLAYWTAQQCIEPFSLGDQDGSDRLLTPRTLYGRAAESGALFAAFERVATQGAAELVLIAGDAGVGKSSVVYRSSKLVVKAQGLFAAGKFEQYKRDIPYATLAQAFQSLVRQLLGKHEAELTRWREALREALGPNGQLIVNLIPELALIIGEQAPSVELSPLDSQPSFSLVFKRFLGVFARAEHPLLLFLDDLQWLDMATRDLLEQLVAEPQTRHLLIVGAYRSDEVTPAHPLARTLDALRGSPVQLTEIALAPLEFTDVNSLIAEILQSDPEAVRTLTELVWEKTLGNPFFTTQFVNALAEEALLSYDPGTCAWRWDLQRIRAQRITENVAHLMAGKLNRSPHATLEALKRLACLGNGAPITTLAVVLDISADQVRRILRPAVRAGLIVAEPDGFCFLHDRVQEACYALMAESERPSIHLQLGRRLAAATPPTKLEETIFELVSQLNLGSALVSSEAEREQLARYNLIAGQRAKAATAYSAAVNYLAAGQAALGENGWKRSYPLAFALELRRAECEFLSGALGLAHTRTRKLARRARSLADAASVTCLRSILYTANSRHDRAIAVCLDYFAAAGIRMAPRPSNAQVRAEYNALKRELGDRSIEALVDAPRPTDPAQLAVFDVLAHLTPPASLSDENLAGVGLLRTVRLSLKYGISDGSCVAFVFLSLVVFRRFGDHDLGLRFARLALELVDRRGLTRFRARTYLGFAMLLPWTEACRASLPLLEQAAAQAVETGDVTFAAYSSFCSLQVEWFCGAPLDELQRRAEEELAACRKAQFSSFVDQFEGYVMLSRTLRGETARFGDFNDSEFDEQSVELRLGADPSLCIIRRSHFIRKLQARYFAGDHVAALLAADVVEGPLWIATTFYDQAEYHFYAALSHALNPEPASVEARHRQLTAITRHQRELQALAVITRDNLGSRIALLDAELARLERRELDAERLYEEAIRSARASGFVQCEALANESTARFYQQRGFDSIARMYFANAHSCYVRWGAEAKARQLDRDQSALRDAPSPWLPTATFGTAVSQFDARALLKAAQALSSEIVLSTLVESLIRIAVEHAGAERGLLILLRNPQPEVVAEATLSHGKLEVKVKAQAVSGSDLPESALNYVTRTREILLLDDASADRLVSGDDYVQRRQPKSVLCIPIKKQTKLLGVLYLENNLTPRVFTPDRISVLEILASQAAISLENAYLYADLQRSQRFLAEAQEVSRIGTFYLSFPTRRLVWSDQNYRNYGFERAQVPELTFDVMLSRVHPEDLHLTQQATQQALRQAAAVSVEFRIILPDGTIRWLHSAAAPNPHGPAGIIEYIGTTTDITERKRSEDALRDAQAELMHVTRATTIGQLAASIAHEVNQPLTGIVANAQACLRLLEKEPPQLQTARIAAERIVRDGLRAGDIIRNVRGLLRKAAPSLEPLDMNELIRDVLDLMRSELRRNGVALELELSDAIPRIVGDRVQLQQVVVNLVMNGIEATRELIDRPRVVRVTTQLAARGDVQITIEDSGTGLDPALSEKIFDPFFTTKPEGMGMGLSICRTLVEAHNGTLTASARSPHGSVFEFTLPSASVVDAADTTRAHPA